MFASYHRLPLRLPVLTAPKPRFRLFPLGTTKGSDQPSLLSHGGKQLYQALIFSPRGPMM